MARLHRWSNGRSAQRFRCAKLIAHCGELGGKDRRGLVTEGGMGPLGVVGVGPAGHGFASVADIEDGLVDVVVVYKIDRLSRSLADFAKLVEVFDRNGVTFVSVTQSFNTTTSMGRLTLNILLSFAQFEREVRRSDGWSSWARNSTAATGRNAACASIAIARLPARGSCASGRGWSRWSQ